MFKIIISEQFYGKIKQEEEGRAPQEQSYLFKLLQQQPVQLLKEDDTKRYIAHPENVLKNPSALYILDIPAADALAIQRMYGVMCLSSSAPDITSLIDVNDEHTTGKKEPLDKGWDSVLDSVEYLPSNALILIDRYLFKNIEAYNGNGFDNVSSILKELLPQELGTTYHITIVFERKEIDPLYSFDTIAKRLYENVEEMGHSYPITMEVLGVVEPLRLYYSTHNRRIVSNYFVVKMDHKLAAFNKNIGTTDQTIIPQVLFTEDSINHHSSPPLKSMQQITTALRDFSQSLMKPSMKHELYSYAVNGRSLDRCIAIRNRLIK